MRSQHMLQMAAEEPETEQYTTNLRGSLHGIPLQVESAVEANGYCPGALPGEKYVLLYIRDDNGDGLVEVVGPRLDGRNWFRLKEIDAEMAKPWEFSPFAWAAVRYKMSKENLKRLILFLAPVGFR